MAKLDDLLRSARSVAAESMGAGRVVTGPEPAAMPDRLRGLSRSKNAAEVPLDRIGPDPDQPREEFDPESLRQLAESLKGRGQLQPIRVRWDDARDQYVILCGERRWRAAQLAGLPTLSCVIVEGLPTPEERLAMQLVENLLRDDLRPIEQARAFRTLMDANGWSTHRLARELCVTQSGVVRALALLDLPEAVQSQVEQGALPPATAYEVSKLADPESQRAVADRVVAEGLSRSEAIAAVREASGRPASGRRQEKGRARKVTSRAFRTSAGPRITVDWRKGLDDELVLAALLEAVEQVRAAGEARAA
jgi:ParB family chromosome partitioning protein